MEASIFILSGFICFILESQAIINNDETDSPDAPFALSLRFNNHHICGAAIINDYWGVTAAHCVHTFKAPASNYSVRSGSKYRESGGAIHNLTKIISHEKYDVSNNDYDIALFSVEPSFQFDDTTQMIELPDNNVNTSWGTAVGWGSFLLKDQDVLSDTLRGVELPKVDTDECIRDYAGLFEVPSHDVCYGYRDGHYDTCKGDSGGPLYNGDRILIGITSWGDECGASRSPGVYIDVQLVRDWIKKNAEM